MWYQVTFGKACQRAICVAAFARRCLVTDLVLPGLAANQATACGLARVGEAKQSTRADRSIAGAVLACALLTSRVGGWLGCCGGEDGHKEEADRGAVSDPVGFDVPVVHYVFFAYVFAFELLFLC
jgi:hypothetical protein